MDKTYIVVELRDEIFECGLLELEQAFNSHHTFRITIAATEGKNWEYYDKLSKQFIGEQIAIQFWDNRDMEKLQHQFAGVVEKANLHCSKGEEVFLELKGRGLSVILDNVVKTRAFCDVSIHDFKNRINDDLGQQANKLLCINSNADKKYPYLVQYEESCYSLLKHLAAENGEWFFFDSEQLHYGKPKGKQAGSELTIGVDLWDFELIQSIQYMGFVLRSYNRHLDRPFVADSIKEEAVLEKKEELGNMIGERSAILTNKQTSSFVIGEVNEEKGLRKLAQVMKQQMAAKLRVIRGHSGKPAFRPGHIIVVRHRPQDGAGTLGTYVIIKTVHRYNRETNSYVNTFVAVDAAAEAMPVSNDLRQRNRQKAFTDRAKVHDTNDPEGCGRIQVKFEWPDEPRLSAWIGVNTIQAGSTQDGKNVRGIFMLPEKGDTVLIAYEYGDPRYPYVVGSSYNKETAKIEDGALKENVVKRIAARGGSHITIIDRIDDKLNQVMIGINDDPLITITDDGKKRTIILETKDEIILKTDTVALKGKNISLEAAGTLELNGRNITMAADQGLNVEAGSISLEGKTGAELKSTGQTVIKGGIVQIN